MPTDSSAEPRDGGARPARVGVTGIGCVSAAGLGVAKLYADLARGVEWCAADAVAAEPAEGGGVAQVPGALLDIKNACGDRRFTRIKSPGVSLAVHAVADLLADAALDLASVDPGRVGLFVAKRERRFYRLDNYRQLITTLRRSPQPGGGAAYRAFLQANLPIHLVEALPGLETFVLGGVHAVQGPALTLLSGEVGGLQAVESAVRYLTGGHIDVAVVVAVHDRPDPLEAYQLRRADRARRLGEGAVAMCLERHEDAARRHALPYAWVLGAGSFAVRDAERPGIGRRVVDRCLATSRAVRGAVAAEGRSSDAGDRRHGAWILSVSSAAPKEAPWLADGIAAILGREGDVSVQETEPLLGHAGSATALFDAAIALAQVSRGTPLPPAILRTVGGRRRGVAEASVLVDAAGSAGINAWVAFDSWGGRRVAPETV